MQHERETRSAHLHMGGIDPILVCRTYGGGMFDITRFVSSHSHMSSLLGVGRREFEDY